MDFAARHLLDAAKRPEIVIADEEMHMYAAASEVSQFLEERHKLPFAVVVSVILHPEIEHIA